MLGFTRFDRIACLVGAVLSDKGKKAMYDAGLFDPLDDDDEVMNQQSLDFVSCPLLCFSPFFLVVPAAYCLVEIH